MRRFTSRTTSMLLLLLLCGCKPDGVIPLVVPEQRKLDIRDPAQLRSVPLPDVPPPVTVSNPAPPVTPHELSLDEAISIALANAKVIRVLAGTTAVSSQRTIYDTAISNTAIDEARAVFDPVFEARNTFSKTETPQALLDFDDPRGARFFGTQIDNYELGLGLTKRTVTGGQMRVDYVRDHSLFQPGLFPLNPQNRSAATVSYTQPLLRGAGIAANVAPIVIARINTERSFFQFKDSVQDLVRGVIEGYWAIVFARTDVWVRQQQVEQGEAAYKRADARKRQGLGNAAEVAQTKVAYANFRANLIASQANLLQREAALRNLLGLPPSDPLRFVPTTPPTPVLVQPNWEEILQLGTERRPDLIELKLVLEADQQSLIQARNQALPQVDAVMLYRWNGLEGETPRKVRIATSAGDFTDWSVGVNFSVPLGLRQSRAVLRRSELILARDEANLEQGVHFMVHTLAETLRNLAQFHSQYRAFQETRAAARENLEQQAAEFRAGRSIFLNVLQAISDWGNAVSAEANALAQYNTELANLERQTGTILESHGIRFVEERAGFIGPCGRLAPPVCYPASVKPGPNGERYPTSSEAAETGLEREKPRLPKFD